MRYKALVDLRHQYDGILEEWRGALDEPELEQELKTRYLRLQSVCRRLKRSPYAMTFEARAQCEVVELPFSARYHALVVAKEDLERSLFEVDIPDTLAYKYRQWPSKQNEQQLRRLYRQVTRYTNLRLPWTLYRRRPEFQQARLEVYLKEWQTLEARYKDAEQIGRQIDARERHRLSERREFAFQRLREELRTNQGLSASRIDPLTLADSAEAFDRLDQTAAVAASAREKAGRSKEVVVFIHGLGDDRRNWSRFPELLSAEDLANPGLDRWFQVYSFRYDTRDNVRSLDEFAREFEVFLQRVVAQEQVDGVSVVAHSMGGVIALRTLLCAARGPLSDDALPAGDVPVSVLAARALEAFKKAPSPLIKRLITLGTPFHGDQLANILVRASMPPTQLYRRFRPFPWRVPFFGTRQTQDIQVGGFHLNSIARLDTEWALEPAAMLPHLEPALRDGLKPTLIARLRQAKVPFLAIAAIPQDAPPLTGLEDDGLVRAFAATPRHCYLWGPEASIDVGFQGADVRYLNSVHYTVKAVKQRDEASYQNVVAFLQGTPLPQATPDRFALNRFLAVFRAYPAGLTEGERIARFFGMDPRVVYHGGEEHLMPALRIEWEDSPGLQLGLTTWHPVAGAVSRAGRLATPGSNRTVAVTLKAEGYQPKRLNIPIQAGQVTYAVHVELEPEIGTSSSTQRP